MEKLRPERERLEVTASQEAQLRPEPTDSSSVGRELYQTKNSRKTDPGDQKLSPALLRTLWGPASLASLWASQFLHLKNEEIGPITGFQTSNFFE